jgi:hypothetical protein
MTSPTNDYADVLSGNVDAVNTYITEHPDEREQVLYAESQAQARKGIMEGPHNPPPTEDAPAEGDTTTKGATFQEAAESFADNGTALTPQAFQEAQAQGFIGTSPERERTGLADKGLSQATPSVMDPTLPPVDARPGQDDSEAIAAAQQAQGV